MFGVAVYPSGGFITRMLVTVLPHTLGEPFVALLSFCISLLSGTSFHDLMCRSVTPSLCCGLEIPSQKIGREPMFPVSQRSCHFFCGMKCLVNHCFFIGCTHLYISCKSISLALLYHLDQSEAEVPNLVLLPPLLLLIFITFIGMV